MNVNTPQVEHVTPSVSNGKSFMEVLTGDTKGVDGSKALKPLVASRLEGGNIIVELDVDDYERGVEELK